MRLRRGPIPKPAIGSIRAAHRFVSKDRLRENLAEPWINDGRLLATNDYMLFSTPWSKDGDGKAVLPDGRLVAPRGKVPNTEGIRFNGGVSISLPRLLIEVLVSKGAASVKPGLFWIDAITREIGAQAEYNPGARDYRPAFDLAYMSTAARTLSDMCLEIERIDLDAGTPMVCFVAGDTSVVMTGIRGYPK